MMYGAFIGIENSNGIQGIYCQNDGKLESVGIKLYLYYNTQEQILKLLKKGNLLNLGRNLNVPNIQFNEPIEREYCYCINSYFKTDFTYAMQDISLKYYVKSVKFKNFEDFIDKCEAVDRIYLFRDNEWITFIPNSFLMTEEMKWVGHKLEDLFTWKKRALKRYFYDITGDKSEIRVTVGTNELQSKMREEKRIFALSDVETCNYWITYLNSNEPVFKTIPRSQPQNFNIAKIGFAISEVKGQGKVYTLYKGLEHGETRKKSLLRSKDINDLILEVCKIYNLNYYTRPVFGKDSILI